jgi:hypothetical protein
MAFADNPGISVTGNNLRCRIGRTIVNYDKFEIRACLGKDTVDGLCNMLLTVIGPKDNARERGCNRICHVMSSFAGRDDKHPVPFLPVGMRSHRHDLPFISPGEVPVTGRRGPVRGCDPGFYPRGPARDIFMAMTILLDGRRGTLQGYGIIWLKETELLKF